jgi:hypothetical protein
MSDAYPYVVAVLDDDRRVIECAARIQWIIQKRVSRRGYPWEGISFCRTKEALIRLAGPDPVLMRLPDRYQEPVSRPAADGRSEFEHGDVRCPALLEKSPPSCR